MFARAIATPLQASAKLFGTYIKPNPMSYPTGRDILMKPLTKERGLKRYFTLPTASYDQLKIPWRFIEKQENQFWKKFRRARKGLYAVAKGQGKKAQKRAKEAAKAAAAKAKAAGKK